MSERKVPIPEIVHTEVVYRGFFDMHVDHLQLPHGPKMPYHVLDIKTHAATVLAKTPEGKYIVNREYRHPTGKWLLSCPGGRMDPGESPLEAACRELREETGYTSDSFILLGSAYPFPGVTEQLIYYILAENARHTHTPTLEDFELIHTELKTREELIQEIASGAAVDGILFTALLMEGIR